MKKRTLVLLALALALSLSGCGKTGQITGEVTHAGEDHFTLRAEGGVITVPYDRLPRGAVPEPGDMVTITYEGNVETGKLLDLEISRETDLISRQQWSREELQQLYEKGKSQSWDLIALTALPDEPGDMVGAVLFDDSKGLTCNVGFLNPNGTVDYIGSSLTLAEDPRFTYLGEGKFSWRVLDDRGILSTVSLSYFHRGLDPVYIMGDPVPVTAE